MKRICLAFYWHMHQPYYFDPATGESSMPWVRMHATKGYLDLISVLGDYPGVKQTFNYVPSLLKQIDNYVKGGVKDLFLEHSVKPASELDPGEKRFILWNFFMVNWDTMLRPHIRYKELLYKRGASIAEAGLADVIGRFTERDMLDLQVWFNLAWFGFSACASYPELAELRKKGSGFSEEEKRRIIEIQFQILKQIIPIHKNALERNQVELTTTPFYHPIMPLVYDSDIAGRAMPNAPLPRRFHHPEDVEAQLAEAARYHESLFGKRPEGLWPSEGSVCPEIVPLVAGNGLKWMASDEGVLFRSIGEKNRFSALYKPYRVEHEGASVDMVFRDRELSDLIGFNYALNTGRNAAEDLMSRIRGIAKQTAADEALISVILDGENPWQGYPDGGEGFLRCLYEKLQDESSVQTVTIGEYLDKNPPRDVIGRLHSGSWIDGNYGVWIGEAEDNIAWERLGSAREALRKHGPSIPEKKLRAAREQIYAAEGSDWFWWYGERFSSDNDEAFDELFRTHLKSVYNLLGARYPETLDEPIINMGRVAVPEEPKAFLKPAIDGAESSYYEWVDAGRYNEVRSDSTMSKTEALVKAIMYGFDKRNLYLRIDFYGNIAGQAGDNYHIHIHFAAPGDSRISFPLKAEGAKIRKFELSHREGKGRYGRGESLEPLAIDRIVELAVPFSRLGAKKGEEIRFYVQVKKEKMQLERHPRSGYIPLTVPDDTFEMEHWSAT